MLVLCLRSYSFLIFLSLNLLHIYVFNTNTLPRNLNILTLLKLQRPARRRHRQGAPQAAAEHLALLARAPPHRHTAQVALTGKQPIVARSSGAERGVGTHPGTDGHKIIQFMIQLLSKLLVSHTNTVPRQPARPPPNTWGKD